MIQNFDDDQLRDMEQNQEDEVLDDEYWYEQYLSQKEDEAIEEYYDKKHGNELRKDL